MIGTWNGGWGNRADDSWSYGWGRLGLGFVRLWAAVGGLQQKQLLEGAVIGAIEGALITHQQSEALPVIGEILKDPSPSLPQP